MDWLNAELCHSATHQPIHGARRKWTKGRSEGKEEFASDGARSDFLQVSDNRVANALDQRVCLIVTSLRTMDVNPLSVPVQIVQSQLGNLATAESIC